MTKRTRHNRLLIPEPLIEASRTYRGALISAHRGLNPNCATYASAQRVAIDDLMAEVTGQRDLFHGKAIATDPARFGMVEGRAGRRVRMAARFRLLAVLLGLSPHAKTLAARAGMIAQFWQVEARTAATVPLMSSAVVCGFPSPADDYMDGPLDFNELLIVHPAATFAVRVAGDSMIGAGIFPGDIAVVDRALKERDGLVVLALLGDEFTIKRYRCKGARCWLQAENPAYADIQVGEDSGFQVWGVVSKAIRMLGA